MRKAGKIITPMEFPWLRYTILNPDEYADHHTLYHILLMPFTFGDLRIGAKWAAVFFPALTFSVFYGILVKNKIHYPLFWTGALFASSYLFLFRMSMPRTQSISLLFMLLGCHFLFHHMHFSLGILAFLFTWFHQSFPSIIILTVIITLVHYMLTKTWDYRSLLSSCIGVLLGLLINPYFLKYPIYMYRQLSHKIAPYYSVPVGGEWYSFKTWDLFIGSAFAFVLYALGIFLLALKQKRVKVPTLALLLISFFFLGLTFKARRFIEFSPPFVILFSAFSMSEFLGETYSRTRLLRRKMIFYPGVVIVWALLGILTFYNISKVQQDIRDDPPFDRYRGGALWLKENTLPGSTVFTTDWDDFPELFFYNSENTYIIGLDPAFMMYYDHRLYQLWRDIAKAQVKDLYQAITENFETEYVFSDNKHTKFIQKALSDDRFTKVYEDRYTTIFHLRNSQS